MEHPLEPMVPGSSIYTSLRTRLFWSLVAAHKEQLHPESRGGSDVIRHIASGLACVVDHVRSIPCPRTLEGKHGVGGGGLSATVSGLFGVLLKIQGLRLLQRVMRVI